MALQETLKEKNQRNPAAWGVQGGHISSLPKARPALGSGCFCSKASRRRFRSSSFCRAYAKTASGASKNWWGWWVLWVVLFCLFQVIILGMVSFGSWVYGLGIFRGISLCTNCAARGDFSGGFDLDGVSGGLVTGLVFYMLWMVAIKQNVEFHQWLS